MEETKQETKQEAEPKKTQNKWFGRGVYGSKDVPIRILDGLILGAIAMIVILTLLSVKYGGFQVTFDTGGGSGVAGQKLKHGDKVKEPLPPGKPGYVFGGWVTSPDPFLAKEWDFAADITEGDMTLYALWEPAQITVKFDLNGGTAGGTENAKSISVTFGEPYGALLPVPEKPGYTFDGWEYGGALITPDTPVTTSGEHVLAARWK